MEAKTSGKSILRDLGTWIVIATVLGAVVGLFLGKSAHMLAPIGDLFMQLIKMIVVPMVFFSLVGGAAALGKSKGAGKVGIVTFLYYGVTTAVAVILGLAFSVFFQPGSGIDMAAISGAAVQVGDLSKAGALPGFWETIIGFALAMLPAEEKEFMSRIVDNCTKICIKIMMAVMMLAPVGVFCLMADATGSFGYDVLMKIIYLIGLYVCVLFLVTYVMIGGSVALFSKCIGYVEFFKAMWKVQVLAFSTASSMAALPLNMAVTERELHVSKGTTSFALPLGATINMNGNAAYYAMAAIFIAQMYGMELTMGQYIAIIVTSTLGAVGQAGVPGPTLLVVAVLVSAGIPIDALPILFGVDRIFDMLRTAVNITGDAACAAIVDRFTNEEVRE